MSTGLRLLGLVLILNIPMLWTLTFISHDMTIVTFGGMVVIAVGLMIGYVYFGGGDGEATFAMFLAVMYAAIGTLYYQEWLAVADGQVVRDISARQIIEHPDAVGYVVTDGRVLHDMMRVEKSVYRGDGDPKNSGTHNWYCVAPLVGPAWRRGDPVDVWVSLHLKKHLRNAQAESWFWSQSAVMWRKKPHPWALLKVGREGLEEYTNAVQAHTQAHQPSTPGAAIIVRFVDDPESEIHAIQWTAWNITLGVNALGLLLPMLYWSFHRTNKSPADNPARPYSYQPQASVSGEELRF
ncbi:MAG: hypothetical protein HN350_14950 [Phycisphaerales bacterium]|nr:hypothetical protein [Phycisphaerales bacterium]